MPQVREVIRLAYHLAFKFGFLTWRPGQHALVALTNLASNLGGLENMRVISRILIAFGLLTTSAANFATYYGIRAAVNGMLDSASTGIGTVAWGMDSAYFYSVVSLLGCFLLIIGLTLAALTSKRMTHASVNV